MRITVFNDTSEDWSLHIGSARGTNDESQIRAHQFVDFEGPNDSELFVKVWNGVVMVRFTKREVDLSKRPLAKEQSALFEANWKSSLKPMKRPYVDSETGLSRV